MCGVIGVIDPQSSETRGAAAAAAFDTFRGLLALQHRGQDAAGILSYDTQTRMFMCEKDLGLVTNVFDQQKIEKLTGSMAIGHTRYATMGGDGRRDIQPMVTGVPFGLGMAHNGNILNYPELADALSTEYNRQLLTANDLEVMINYFADFLMNGKTVADTETFSFGNIKSATEKMFGVLTGGYAVVALLAGQGMVAFRDPKGIRPLVLGMRETDDGRKAWCIASESIAVNYLGYAYQRDIAAGEVVFIDMDGNLQSAMATKEKQKAPCMFEWVYFSGAESTIDHQPVYGARLRLGERLAARTRAAIEAQEISPDVVMPVPDTSRPAAIAAAEALNLPYREGLIKNRYVARSFILSGQDKREWAVELKLSPVPGEIEGKNILLIDDSIVRGTTSKRIISLLRKYGAKEITLAITCPPHRHACFYGIDFPDPADLVAHGKTVEQIAETLGVNKVIYLDEQDLREAIGLTQLCMACINGKYPTATKDAEEFSQARKRLRAAG
ncbi:MAG TPA: amidophosphoribosyltransferase [Alphaproteobacteria bacterium]|nr:amidophosphoribosyltransferase [Rhodospirillaceae bacterium]HRJ65880.1 amidophosphoribosyltransferase [Alphaproteobacteria bacterium]